MVSLLMQGDNERTKEYISSDLKTNTWQITWNKNVALTWTVHPCSGARTLFSPQVWWWTSWHGGHHCSPLCCHAACMNFLYTQPNKEDNAESRITHLESQHTHLVTILLVEGGLWHRPVWLQSIKWNTYGGIQSAVSDVRVTRAETHFICHEMN